MTTDRWASPTTPCPETYRTLAGDRYGDGVRIATWNVNSLRSRAPQLLRWLDDRQVDVALLQETKCGDSAVPINELAALGYEVAHHGTNQWNGVAIVSRVGIEDVVRGLEGPLPEQFDEPRLIAATCGAIRCWSVYVPNGRSKDDPHFVYKLLWLDRLRAELAYRNAADGVSLVAGDFNVGRADVDFYDAKRWHNKKHATPEERLGVEKIIELGLVDAARSRFPKAPMFTWWNYVGTQFAKDKGLRIDLALASPTLDRRVTGVWVDRDARDPVVVSAESMASTGEDAKPSDHAPLIVDLT